MFRSARHAAGRFGASAARIWLGLADLDQWFAGLQKIQRSGKGFGEDLTQPRVAAVADGDEKNLWRRTKPIYQVGEIAVLGHDHCICDARSVKDLQVF
jgi:hypothetical protein